MFPNEKEIINIVLDVLVKCLITFWNISVPSEKWHDSPEESKHPDSEDFQQSSIVCHWFCGQTFYDNIVTIKCNQSHGPDRGTAE